MATLRLSSNRAVSLQAEDECALTKALLGDHGWNTTCFQILNPGIDLWFARDRSAVVGYTTHRGVRVVAGAPVCDLQDLPKVVAEFEAACCGEGQRMCYFGAESRMRELTIEDSNYSSVALGAQPYWSPATFVAAFASNASLRKQLNRSRNKGVTVSEWPQSAAATDPDLRRCLDDWLQTRGLPPMHFLVEPETLGALNGRRIFVAERRGRPVGFTVLSPVPQRNGYLTEQFIRGREAPNGTVELGLYTAISKALEEGAEYITMGIVPLSQHGAPAAASNPRWLRVLTGWVRAHGRRFYNFDGLDAFKSKFVPDGWEPIYVISKESKFSFRTLYAIASAFGAGSPAVMVLGGLVKALRQEIRWLADRIHAGPRPIP